MSTQHIKHPCPECPFRKDTFSEWLGESRMKEILESRTFPCHKTTDGKKSDWKQCTGHMLIKKEGNDFYRIAGILKVPLELTGHELIFDSEKDCIEHHKFK